MLILILLILKAANIIYYIIYCNDIKFNVLKTIFINLKVKSINNIALFILSFI